MKHAHSPSGFWKTAVTLALPIALQNLLTSSASLIDTAMIVPLGNTAVAAVGVAGRFTFLLNTVSFGFCSGCATMISQFWGAQDRTKIRHSFGVATVAAMTTAILFASVLALFPHFCISVFGPEADAAAKAAEYLRIVAFAMPLIMFSQISCAALRATEKVSVPLISSAAAVVTNTFLNYCLINGHFGFLALGVRGAAIATVIGTTVQAVIVFFALQFGKNAVRAKPRDYFSFDRGFVKKYTTTAFPALLNETLWAVGTNVYVMVLARQGTEEYSGYTLFETVQQLFFVFFVGICHASAIMVGKAVGRGDTEEGYRTAKRFVIMTPLLGVIMGTILIFTRGPLLSLFEIETEGARLTALSLLLFYGFWIGMRMIAYTCICGIFRAGGDTKTGCFLDLGCLFLSGVPAVCLTGLVFDVPFVLVAASMFIAEDIPKNILCIRHFLSKKWIKQLTK